MAANLRNILKRLIDAAPPKRRKRVADAMAEKDAALAALFETGTAGICEVDMRSGRFLSVNRRFCEIVKRDAALLLTLAPGDIVHPEDRAAVETEMASAMATSSQWEGEVRYLLPDGGVLWVRVGASVWRRDEFGAPLRRIAVVQDVTESVMVKERLKQSEELLRLGHRVGRIGSFVRDLKTGELQCSPEARHIFGLAPVEGTIPRAAWMAGFLAEEQSGIAEAIDAALKRRDPEIACECRIRRRSDGRFRHLEMRAHYFYDEAGQPTRSVGVVIDITERKEAEERFAHAAKHDALTGLPNRALFQERLNEASARARQGEAFAVLCLDLDRFKDVNDTFGHPEGDRLLIEAVARFRSELRAEDTLARLGGDEFAIIQTGLSNSDEAARLARRLVDRLAEPFTLKNQRVLVGASIGVAIAPRDGTRDEDLLIAADLALYRAKAQPARGWRFFEPQMNEQAQLRRELEHDLRKALENGEFEVFYQPVLDVSTLRVRRFEALARWRHPQRGLVMPDRFIPLCEEIGLIWPLGEWVLRRACADAMTWPETIGVSVNISAVQVGAGQLDRVVAAALADSGLAAHRLELEITETALLKDSEATLSTLHKLKALGVRIAMDDFGAGHSSLGYLQRFPFDKVKIDRGFTKTVDQSPKSAAIVRAIINLCGALGMSTTIEGVETEAQFEAVAKMGGQRVQGYLFSPPQPVDRVPALIAQFGGSPGAQRAAE
jgi:diguanylate cyclase (GGDEF)-like protein/PAS domain S-box-containing protein